MNITGSVNLEIDRLNTDSVDVNVKGSGEIRLAGRAGSQHVSISGSGRYYSEELETGLAEISIPGSASIKVWVRDELNVKITGSGTVRYFGTPTVTQRVLGSGKVLPQGAK